MGYAAASATRSYWVAPHSGPSARAARGLLYAGTRHGHAASHRNRAARRCDAPADGDVYGDPTLPEPYIVEPGGIVEPGFAFDYRMPVHCGIEWLGSVNSVNWRTEVPVGTVDYVPPEWRASVEGESIVVSITLRTDPAPTITARANGHRVVYHATAQQPPGCD